MTKWLISAALIIALNAAMAYAQQPAPDAQFTAYALQIVKQQRDQAMDQIVTLGAQLAQARDELQQLKARKEEKKDDPSPQDH